MLVIDGYNVLFALLGGKIDSKRIKEDRDALVGRIGGFCRSTRQKARIIFDPSSGISGTQKKMPVEAVYLSTGTADQAIIDLIGRKGDRTAYRVVTSDREVSKAAEKMRYPVVTAEQFLDEMKAALDAPEPDAAEKEKGISASEADAWMKTFGLEGDNDETR